MVALFVGVALALDGPLSAPVAILGLFASAAASAFALWLGLSPYREKYAEDPEGKRAPTLKRDAELVNMLWWDIVFSFVVWVVLGFGAAYLLTQGMNLLTEHQGTMLQIFVLLTIPLIAVSGSGGTAQRHLKADWVEPLAKITRSALLCGFGFFGLLVIQGTLNWFDGTFIGLLRTKGGLFFELGYVIAIAAAMWFSFSALWLAAKEASAAHDGRLEAARKAKPKAKATKAKPKPSTAAPVESRSAPSQSPASDEFDSLRLSVSDLEQAHEKALLGLRDAVLAADEPGNWSSLTARWIDAMVAFLRDREAAPPQWLHAADVSPRNDNNKAEMKEQTENSATRLMGAWLRLRPGGVSTSTDSSATGEQGAAREAHRAMTGLIDDVTRVIDGVSSDSQRAYAQSLVQTSESEQPSSTEHTEAQVTRDLAEAINELLERAIAFDSEKLKQARAKWLEDVEYTPRPETREFAKLVFEDPRGEKCIDLVKAGANPNVKAGYDVTALIHASETGLSDLVKAMLENGAFPDQRGSHQQTALSNALTENHSDIAMMLIEAGANVNTTGNCGFTPLMYAASKGNDAMVSLLMERGADSEYRAPEQFLGMNAEEMAIHNGHNATADLIAELKSKYRPKVTIPHGMGYPGRDDAYYEECFEVQCALVKVLD